MALIGVASVLLVGFVFSYYGEEQVNYFSPQEVAATSWLYAHAPAGAMIVGPDRRPALGLQEPRVRTTITGSPWTRPRDARRSWPIPVGALEC